MSGTGNGHHRSGSSSSSSSSSSSTTTSTSSSSSTTTSSSNSLVSSELEEELAPRVTTAFGMSKPNRTLARQVAALAVAFPDYELFRIECAQQLFPVTNALVLKEVFQKVLARCGVARPKPAANSASAAVSFSEFTDQAEQLSAGPATAGGLQRKEMGEVRLFSPHF